MLDGQMIQIQMFISATHYCMAVPRNGGNRKWAAEFALDVGNSPVAGIMKLPEKQKD
jgi:hypothetical protein